MEEIPKLSLSGFQLVRKVLGVETISDQFCQNGTPREVRHYRAEMLILLYAHEASIGFVSSSDSGYTFSGSSDYSLNKWYHTAFVFDQGNVGVHFNGTLENSENFEFSSISDSSESLLVGTGSKPTTHLIKPFMDPSTTFAYTTVHCRWMRSNCFTVRKARTISLILPKTWK